VRNQIRKTYADKPVVFIAVNSGTTKADVEGYAKSTGFEWPILVDTSRATEKALIGQEISLQNIYQWVVIDPDGKAQRMGPDQATVDSRIQQLLPSAKFTFDGIAVPDKLKPLAKELELGFYETGIAELAVVAAKGTKDLGEAAKAMYAKFTPLAEGGLERGKAAQAEGKPWAAYVEFERVAAWFKKTDYEKQASAALSDLKKDKAVKDELAARQMLEQARGLMATGKKPDAAQAQGLLQVLAKKFPETEAGKEAAKLSR
jgi:hypothetical protein